MKKKILILAMAGMLAATSLTGCGSFKDDDVVAVVGDKEITADIANFYARYTQAQYETYYAGYLGEDMWNSEAMEGQTYEESVKDSVLKQLETMILLEEHMGDYEVSLSDKEKNAIESTAKEFDEANALEDKEKISGSLKTVKRVMRQFRPTLIRKYPMKRQPRRACSMYCSLIRLRMRMANP